MYLPEFINAVKGEGLDLDAAVRQAAIELPAAVQALGEAADQRAIPVLLEGLEASNIAIARASALGLARLHNNRYVPAIIAACARFSRDERPIIAKALFYFDSSPARRAAGSIVENRQLVERWQKEADHRGWKNAMRDSLR